MWTHLDISDIIIVAVTWIRCCCSSDWNWFWRDTKWAIRTSAQCASPSSTKLLFSTSHFRWHSRRMTQSVHNAHISIMATCYTFPFPTHRMMIEYKVPETFRENKLEFCLQWKEGTFLLLAFQFVFEFRVEIIFLFNNDEEVAFLVVRNENKSLSKSNKYSRAVGIWGRTENKKMKTMREYTKKKTQIRWAGMHTVWHIWPHKVTACTNTDASTNIKYTWSDRQTWNGRSARELHDEAVCACGFFMHFKCIFN